MCCRGTHGNSFANQLLPRTRVSLQAAVGQTHRRNAFGEDPCPNEAPLLRKDLFSPEYLLPSLLSRSKVLG